METVLPYLGTWPNRLWPIPADDGHAERVFIDEPNMRVTLEVFAKASRSPLHIHTHADRFVYVAQGDISFITQKGLTRIGKGEGLIIRADYPHGFLIPDTGAKLVHLSIGIGAEQSQSRLPAHIAQQFAPLCEQMTKIRAFEHETRWKDLYAQFEVQTMQWVKESMLSAFEHHRPLPFDLNPCKREHSIPMQGWQTPSAFILKVRGHSCGFSYHEENGHEYLTVNRVFTLRFAMNRSDKKILVLK